METVTIDAKESSEIKKEKFDKVFDPSFKLEEISITRNDVPPQEIQFKDTFGTIFHEMVSTNSAYYSYKASYAENGPLKGITYHFEAWLPGSKPSLLDYIKRWWKK